MPESREQPKQRVSPLALPGEYRTPPRPDGELDATAADAHRQTGFVLGKELRLFERGMNLQLAILRDSYAVRYRKPPLAAIAMLWSRAYAYERDAVALALAGSYVSALPLLGSAAEALAAQEALRRGAMPLFEAWLAEAGRPDAARKAVSVPMGRFRAGSDPVGDPAIGAVYRATAALADTSFGASMVGVAPESNMQKLSVSFGERAFHLGWAELTLGWALTLVDRQLALAADAVDIFNVTEERQAQRETFAAEVGATLARRDRCRVEELGRADGGRLVIANFRRAPGGAQRRLAL